MVLELLSRFKALDIFSKCLLTVFFCLKNEWGKKSISNDTTKMIQFINLRTS